MRRFLNLTLKLYYSKFLNKNRLKKINLERKENKLMIKITKNLLITTKEVSRIRKIKI